MQLALACALAALFAKEIMNVYTWTLGASHTPAALLAVAGTGLPFDLTDTVASFLFGLAFGPELARLLARMRARMDVALGAAARAPHAAAATRRLRPRPAACARSARRAARGAADRARAWRLAAPHAAVSRVARARAVLPGVRAERRRRLRRGAGQRSSELYTGWAAMGLAAAGRDPASVRRGGHSVLDALRARSRDAEGAGDVERTILALRACGASRVLLRRARPRRRSAARARRATARSTHQVNLTAFAVFALRAAGHSPQLSAIREAAGWLARQQDADGGFGFAARGGRAATSTTPARRCRRCADAGARNRRVLGLADGLI